MNEESIYGEFYASGADGALFVKDNIITKIQKQDRLSSTEIVELNHPHIVPIKESKITKGNLIQSMPFYKHGCVRTNLHLFDNEENIITLYEQIKSAISYLHKNDIQHGDIKPENILIESIQPLKVRLTDFSRAKQGFGSYSITNTRGSKGYEAPEAIAGMPCKESDWYSLGATIAFYTLWDVHQWL